MFRPLLSVSILLLLSSVRSQCDSDDNITVFLNSSNPYCTKYSGSDCICCGYSEDNLYLYGSECTIGTSNDLLAEERIIKQCDVNCATGYCQNGVCSKCTTLNDQSQKFYLYVSPNDGTDSCVTQCEHFKGFFAQQEAQACSNCPNSCTICASSEGCQECNYNLERWLDADQFSFTTEIYAGSQDCTQHQTRQNLSTGDDGYLTQFYITPANRSCNEAIQCDGTIDNPYDDINLVFKQLIENVKIGKQTKLKIEIFFLKDNDNIAHFWREDSSLPIHYKRLFERTLVDATLSAANCNDAIRCFSDQEKPIILIKSNLISIFATWKLSIQNVIFDGSELIPDGTCYETYKNSTQRCCNSLTSADLPIPIDAQSDAICNPEMALGTLLHPYLNYDPVADVWPFGPYSLITMQTIYDSSEVEIPTLIIDGCEFRHFWYHRYARSLIALHNYGSDVTIKDTSFHNFYFTYGLITNVQESIQRDTLFTENVVSDFDCTRMNPALSNCFSLVIEGSSFTNSLFGDFEFSNAVNQLTPSDTLASAALSKNEGIVLFLVSFNGPITIVESNFENLASSVFSTSKITCLTERRVIFQNLFHSIDRLIQIELGHEKYRNVQSSSVMNIRNLLKGITIYNNTFQNNLAQTGTNFFIHNFKHSDTYPIIVEQNSFKHNLAQLFGSSFAIVNYGRDYVNIRCEGIYIAENTFEENLQCPDSAGNAIVSCIPEKSVLSPIFSQTSMSAQVNEGSTWDVYYPSVNQATDPLSDHYTTITQLSFTKFYRYLYDTLCNHILLSILRLITIAELNNVIHPITNATIDISRVQVLSNSFISNYASLAQLFIQGASKINMNSNIFKDNTFPFRIFFPDPVTSIPIFAKVIDKESGYLVAGAVIIRLAGYLNMNDNVFINNTQVATTSPGLTVGSAISIDRYLGYIDIQARNTNITNHIGFDFAAIRNLNSFKQSQTANTTLQFIEKNGVTPPLITESFWENFAGITYSANVDPSTPVDTSNRQTVMQGEEVGCNIFFRTGTVQSNVFSSGINTQGFSTLEGVLSLFSDDDRETTRFTLSNNYYGQIFNSGGTAVELSNYFFYLNHVLDNRNFLSSSTYAEILVLNSTFQYNYIIPNSETTKNALIAIAPQGMMNPGVYINYNLWEYNVGILFLVDYADVITNLYSYPDVIVNDNVINHHYSPFATIYAYTSYLVQFNGLTAYNVTAVSAFMIFETNTDSTWLYNVNITNLTTSYNGCLAMYDTRDRTRLVNVSCNNPLLIVPNLLNNLDENFQNIGACFTIQDQWSTDLIFVNVSCNSPRIVYENPNSIQPSTIKVFCIYINAAYTIRFKGFNCVNATYEGASQIDSNLVLAWLNNADDFIFTDGVFKGNNGVAPIQASSVDLSFTNTQIMQNSFQTLSSFLYFVSGTIQLNKIQFANNTCQTQQCSGGITLLKGEANIQNCTFTDNYATRGGVLDVKLVYASISNSTFTGNKASLHSSVLISYSSDMTISNCIFLANNAPSRTFTLSGGSFKTKDSYFSDNNDMKSAVPYIRALNLEINIMNTTFRATAAYESTVNGFFIAVQQGSAYIQGCSFSDGSGGQGGAIYVGEILNSIVIQDCNFTSNKAAYGGAIYADGANVTRNFLIDNCVFENNSATKEAGAFWNQASNTTVQNSYFKTVNYETIRFGKGYYLITNTTLEGNKGDSQEPFVSNSTFAIYASNVYSLNLTDSSVRGFNLDESQAASLSSPIQFIGQNHDIYYLENVIFEGNSGDLGGVIFASSQLDLVINNCSFINNSATIGGAIYFNGSLSNLIIEGNCIFKGNEALSSGGAIQYTSRNVKVDLTKTSFIGNQAPYGSDIGGYGIYLEAIPFNTTLYETYLANKQALLNSWDRLLQQSGNSSVTIYPYSYENGEELNPPLMYALKDEFHSIVTYDNHSTAKIEALKVGTSAVDILYKGNPSYTAFMGYFIIDELEVYVGPYSGVQLNAALAGINGTQSLPNEYDFPYIPDPTPTIVPAKFCVIGERLSDVDTCVPCPNEEFTLTNGSRDNCNECPESGVCGGMSIFGPKIGYWRLSPSDIKLDECRNSEACLGALIEEQSIRDFGYCPPNYLYNESFCLIGWCNRGYEGKLCADCRDGWAASSALLGTCAECNNNVPYYAIQILLIFAGIIYLIILIRSSFKYSENGQKDPSVYQQKKPFVTITNPQESARYDALCVSSPRKGKETIETDYQITHQDNQPREFIQNDTNKDTVESPRQELKQNSRLFSEVYLRILTSHIQTVAIIGTFDLEWPQQQKSYFAVGQALSESPVDIFSFDCLFKQSFLPGIGLRAFATKLVVISVSPIVFFILITTAWTIFYIIKYRKNFKIYWAQLMISIFLANLVFLFVVHPSILYFSMKTFWCEVLGDSADSSYLEADPEMKCWSPEHLRLFYGVALPSLIIWGVGIPTLGLLLLIKNRKKLKEFITKKKYGFLYEGYQEKYYYWEVVVTYRKLMYILIGILLSQSSLSVKACAALGLGGAAYLLQLRYLPYQVRTLNELEKRSIIIATFTLYCAMFQITRILAVTIKVISIICLIAINLYFFVYWFIGFARAKSQEYLVKYPRLVKYCGGLLRFFANFKWENILKKKEKISITEQAKDVHHSPAKEKSIKDLFHDGNTRRREFDLQAPDPTHPGQQIITPDNNDSLLEIIKITAPQENFNKIISEISSPDLLKHVQSEGDEREQQASISDENEPPQDILSLKDILGGTFHEIDQSGLSSEGQESQRQSFQQKQRSIEQELNDISDQPEK